MINPPRELQVELSSEQYDSMSAEEVAAVRPHIILRLGLDGTIENACLELFKFRLRSAESYSLNGHLYTPTEVLVGMGGGSVMKGIDNNIGGSLCYDHQDELFSRKVKFTFHEGLMRIVDGILAETPHVQVSYLRALGQTYDAYQQVQQLAKTAGYSMEKDIRNKMDKLEILPFPEIAARTDFSNPSGGLAPEERSRLIMAGVLYQQALIDIRDSFRLSDYILAGIVEQEKRIVRDR